jgi:uncharacterized membrane protein
MLAWLARHETKFIAVLALVVFALISGIGWAKYAAFGYNSIDLAYFSQTLWHFVHGSVFQQTIHPHLTLGDHAELVLPLLTPLYALFPDPRTLIVLQAAALVAPVLPLYQLARARAKHDSPIPLFVCAAYLLYPPLHSAGLFEFHALVFALFPLFCAMKAYAEKRESAFLSWCLAALLVREDVALVVAAFGALAFIEKRSWWWRAAPVALGGAWFVLASQLIAYFSPSNGYKFAVYYEWLQSASPVEITAHVLSPGTLDMVLGLLMPVLFVPLAAAQGLVLAIGPVLQMTLNAAGANDVVARTHYALLFLPGIFYAVLHGAPKVADRKDADSTLLAWLSCVAIAYCVLVVSPLPRAALMARHEPGTSLTQTMARAVQLVPQGASVAASYRLLPALAGRDELFSLHYAFLGVTQFAEQPYALPHEIDYLVLDLDDIATYRAQFTHTAWAAPHYDGGFTRLAALFANRPLCRFGDVVIAGPRTARLDLRPACHGMLGAFINPEMAGGVVGEAALRARAERAGDALLVLNGWLGTERRKVRD